MGTFTYRSTFLYAASVWISTAEITKYVLLHKEYHSVCPLVGIGTLPTPLSPASVPLPPEPGGGAHSPTGEGLGSPSFDDWRKSLALGLLYGKDTQGTRRKTPT
jgi:hypothetical protein